MIDIKRAAGEYAARFVESGMTLGLGTGSTVEHFLRRLGERIRAEKLQVRGVATSRATEESARTHGIPLLMLAELTNIDLTVDGADEVDGAFRMIKGHGGALLREKVVASISKFEVIVVGANKIVTKLGTTFALPVEVVPFALATVRGALERHGSVVQRQKNGEPYITDNGNVILDVRFANGIEDPASLETALLRIPGVVEVGLFIGLAHRLVIGHDDGRIEVRDLATCGTGTSGGEIS